MGLCLSQVGNLSKWMNGSSWIFAQGLRLTCLTVFKNSDVSNKVTSLWNLSQSLNLENFAPACRSSQLVVNNVYILCILSSTVSPLALNSFAGTSSGPSFVDYTCDGRRAVNARPSYYTRIAHIVCYTHPHPSIVRQKSQNITRKSYARSV